MYKIKCVKCGQIGERRFITARYCRSCSAENVKEVIEKYGRKNHTVETFEKECRICGNMYTSKGRAQQFCNRCAKIRILLRTRMNARKRRGLSKDKLRELREQDARFILFKYGLRINMKG